MKRTLWFSIAVLAVGGPARRRRLCRRLELAAAKPVGARRAARCASNLSGDRLRLHRSGARVLHDTRGRSCTRRALKLLQLSGQAAAAGAAQLVPEGAAGFPSVSNDGKTLHFTIRPGFKFSDGRPSRRRTSRFAFDRALQPDAAVAGVVRSSNDIVGAQAVIDGKARRPRGVKVKGNKLTIRLTAGPTSSPGSRCRSSRRCRRTCPIDPEGVNERATVSAGPYYVSEREPNRHVDARSGTRT